MLVLRSTVMRWLPALGLVGLSLASLATAGCGGSAQGASGPRGQQVAPRPQAGEGARTMRAQPIARQSAMLQLPGHKAPQLVQYEVVDGMAIYEGDIMLGPASEVSRRYAASSYGEATHRAVTVNDKGHLWPGGFIPYEIDSSVSQQSIGYIQWAIQQANMTELELRPRTPADTDYVVFRDTGNGCTSYVGRIGGPQTISTTGCQAGNLLHEILHAAGFHHEQSRSDRDQWITIVWSEIAPQHHSIFDKAPASRSQDIGPYDYQSVMHYGATAFSATGKPTIIPKVAGAQIGQREGLSALDKAAITQLYGAGGGAPPATGQPGQTGQSPIPGLNIPGLPAGWTLPQGLPAIPGLPGFPAQLPATLPNPFPNGIPGWLQ